MNAGALLKAARARERISQAELARRVGTDRGQISRYESGKVSPTVDTLNRILAVCGLQVRGTLEPWLADVDERLDTLLAKAPQLNPDQLPNLIGTLEADPEAKVSLWPRASRGPRKPCTWAFDGNTALLLQGLAVEDDETSLVVVFDDAAKAWLRALEAPLDVDHRRINIGDASDEQILAGLQQRFFVPLAIMLRVRPVKELPPTVRLAVPWYDRPIPVATVDAVEQAHPQHAELLRRLRERRQSRAE